MSLTQGANIKKFKAKPENDILIKIDDFGLLTKY